MWEDKSDDQKRAPAPVNTFGLLVNNKYQNSAVPFVLRDRVVIMMVLEPGRYLSQCIVVG